MLKDPQYARKEPLAIIQASDHHSKNDCGKNLSYFKLTRISFDELRICFSNPNEMISTTERPENKNIIKQIASNENTICIEKYHFEEVVKGIVAILNNNYGSLLIGVTADEYNNIKGIDFNETESEKILDSIISEIEQNKIYYSCEIKVYPFGRKKVLQIKTENLSEKMFTFDGQIYVKERRTNKAVVANSKTLIEMVRNKSENNHLDSEYNKQLDKLFGEIQFLQNRREKYKIHKKIYNDTIKLSGIINMEMIIPDFEEKIESKYFFGADCGKIYYAERNPPRTEDVYIRCTCPVIEKEIDTTIEGKMYNGECIVIVPGGASHIIDDSDYKIINNKTVYPLLRITIREEFKGKIDLTTLLAWYKSSLFIWDTIFQYGTDDNYVPRIFKSIVIPVRLLTSKVSLLINNKVKQIISLEKNFFKSLINVQKNSVESEEQDNLIMKSAQEHNQAVDILACEIDNLMYSLFEIELDELHIIEEMLDYKDILYYENEMQEEIED